MRRGWSDGAADGRRLEAKSKGLYGHENRKTIVSTSNEDVVKTEVVSDEPESARPYWDGRDRVRPDRGKALEVGSARAQSSS